MAADWLVVAATENGTTLAATGAGESCDTNVDTTESAAQFCNNDAVDSPVA